MDSLIYVVEDSNVTVELKKDWGFDMFLVLASTEKQPASALADNTFYLNQQ